MFDEAVGRDDAACQALGAGIAMALDDDPLDPAEEGARVFGIVEAAAHFRKSAFIVGREVIGEDRCFDFFQDDASDPFSGFEEDVSCKPISDKDINFSLKDIAPFDVSNKGV